MGFSRSILFAELIRKIDNLLFKIAYFCDE